MPPLVPTWASNHRERSKGWIAKRSGAQVGEDDRGLGDVERATRRVRRNVREVDEHAEALHLTNYFLSESSQPTVDRGIRRRICPWHVLVMGKR